MRYLYKNKHWPINKEYNLDKLLYLMIDRPNRIRYDGDLFWMNNNKTQFHREYDLPSNIYFLIIEHVMYLGKQIINGIEKKSNQLSFIIMAIKNIIHTAN